MKRKLGSQKQRETATLLDAALTRHKNGDLEGAEKLYCMVLHRDPENVAAQHFLGLTQFQRGSHEDGLEHVRRSLIQGSKNPGFYSNYGSLLHQLQRYEDAIDSFTHSLNADPTFHTAFNGRGNALVELGRYDEARGDFYAALGLKSDYPEAFNGLGNCFLGKKNFEGAIVHYDTAIRLRTNYSEALCNKALALWELQDLQSALKVLEHGLMVNPGHLSTHIRKGNILLEMNDFSGARSAYYEALKIDSLNFDATLNQAVSFHKEKSYFDAMPLYEKAISLNPNSAEALNSFGVLLQEIGRRDDALLLYNRAISHSPDTASYLLNKATLLREMKFTAEALEIFEKVLQLEASANFVLGNVLFLRCQLARWSNFYELRQSVSERVFSKMNVSTPFAVLSLFDDPDLHMTAAQLWVKSQVGVVSGEYPPALANERLRISYFSSDFYDHATTTLCFELFAAHDRTKFEVFGMSFGPQVDDRMSSAIKGTFDECFDVSLKSDTEIRALCRSLGISIAIDLKGYTQGSRPGIFASRCAPIQISWLGYPGTLGATFIDYTVVDPVVVDFEQVTTFTERLIILPGSYQVNSRRQWLSPITLERSDVNLPESGFIFSCFNNTFKIHPDAFSSWMRILLAVDGSVLWLLEDNEESKLNLRREAESRGVESNRLIFAPRTSYSLHFARQNLADLFLDTWPYNAHTTASDALCAGLPVLTLIGRSFPARVSASLLYSVGLSELVTRSKAEYECRAIELASNRPLLEGLKIKVQRLRHESVLFDSHKFARQLEASFEIASELKVCGDEASHFCITRHVT